MSSEPGTKTRAEKRTETMRANRVRDHAEGKRHDMPFQHCPECAPLRAARRADAG